jgi:hypothetical protein
MKNLLFLEKSIKKRCSIQDDVENVLLTYINKKRKLLHFFFTKNTNVMKRK